MVVEKELLSALFSSNGKLFRALSLFPPSLQSSFVHPVSLLLSILSSLPPTLSLLPTPSGILPE